MPDILNIRTCSLVPHIHAWYHDSADGDHVRSVFMLRFEGEDQKPYGLSYREKQFAYELLVPATPT